MTEILNRTSRLNKKAFLLGLGIFALALLIRLIYLWQASDGPTFLEPIVDSEGYDIIARSFAAGEGFSRRFFWQVFFYPIFLSVVYFFSGGSIVAAKIVQVILSALVCGLVYHLGCKIFDRKKGILAGVIAAFYGPLIFFDSELLATGWASVWAVVLIILFLKAGQRSGFWIYFVLGICGGLSIITRATFLPFFAAACVWLIFALHRIPMPWTNIIPRGALVLTGFLLIVCSVATLCYRATGRFSPLPETGPLNLYMGNNSRMSAIMALRPGENFESLLRLPRQHGSKSSRQDREFFRKKVWQYVTTEPLDFAARLGHKTVHYFTSREIPSNFDPYSLRKYSTLLSALVWKVSGLGFPFGFLLPLAAIGIFCHWRQVSVPVALFLVLYPLAIILVFVTARYRTPTVPILIIFAAAGVFDMIETIKSGRWGKVVVMALVIIAIAGLSSMAGPFDAEAVNYEAELYYCLGTKDYNRGQIENSIAHLSEAVRLNPDYSDAHITFGLALAKQGKFDQAISEYNKALEINPLYYGAHQNLANALRGLGKFEQAAFHYLQEVRIHPENTAIYANLGSVYGQLGKHREAIIYLDKALDVNPRDYFGNYNMGIVLLQIEKPDKAIVYFSRALEISPKLYNAHYNMAIALLKLSKANEAVEHLQKAYRYAQESGNQSAAQIIKEELEPRQ